MIQTPFCTMGHCYDAIRHLQLNATMLSLGGTNCIFCDCVNQHHFLLLSLPRLHHLRCCHFLPTPAGHKCPYLTSSTRSWSRHLSCRSHLMLPVINIAYHEDVNVCKYHYIFFSALIGNLCLCPRNCIGDQTLVG